MARAASAALLHPLRLAFGKKGRQGGRVPPDATVQFDVQLLTVKRAGTNPDLQPGPWREKHWLVPLLIYNLNLNRH
eukprot:26262_4